MAPPSPNWSASGSTSVPTEIKLDSGEVIRANDHVFCQTPFIGHAWAVGRVMEILAPQKWTDWRKPTPVDLEPRVRLAVYLRPDEVTGRRGKDDRLLYSAFKSFIHPISNVRGRCFVKHKSHIDDLAAWKNEPNHFYFDRLYDEYLKREYDVVAIKAYRNLPVEIRDILASRYSFLVCEKEAFAEYSVEFQSCRVCTKWASPPDSVRCSICAESYHMSCCSPRVLSKPIRGYSWTCAPCYLQHEEDVDNHRAPAKPKLEKALKAAELFAKVPSSDKVLRTFRGWPMRYLGLYNLAEDTMDADDGIFPRSASRVGSKFQATWLPEVGDHDRGEDVYERGGDETVKLKSRPSAQHDALLESIQQVAWKPPPPANTFDIGVLERIAHLGTTLDAAAALKALRTSTLGDFDRVLWSEDQLRRLVKCLEEHHGLDSYEASLKTGRSPAHCVRQYREWKRVQLANFWKTRATAESDAPDDLFPPEGLLAEKDLIFAPDGQGVSCSACSRSRSGRWWTMIQEDYEGVYCDGCHTAFLRYAQIPRKALPEAVKVPAKAEKTKNDDRDGSSGPPPKKPKLSRGSSPKSSSKASPAPLPPPAIVRPPPKALPCALCKVHEPAKNPVARCSTCAFSVHPACYGIPDPASVTADWQCELCANVETELHRRIPRCVLCPGTWRLKGPPPAVPQPSHLHALKPTLDGNWSHLYCSIFQPATWLSNPAEMMRTEGLDLIEPSAWTTPCSICHRANQGAVVPCSDCHDVFHVACAHKTGYTFGMEISLTKSSRKDTQVVKFKDERGLMHPRIICKKHDVGSRLVYPLHEKDETTGQTALETYVGTYKAPPVGVAPYPLLRRAEALQRVLSAKASTKATVRPASGQQPTCATCLIAFSPMWYPSGNGDGTVLCHTCFLPEQQRQRQQQQQQPLPAAAEGSIS